MIGLCIGQFDRYDMCIDTSWSISDVSYDTLDVTMLLELIYAFQVFFFKHLIGRRYVTGIEYAVVVIIIVNCIDLPPF